ncbi:MAG: hypothetical protein E6I40_12535 [Chloroflexi bacterium]|nr:MAG: hypothetical protein E6I40_12535 [Chloroflexota bacterium]
MRPPYPVEIVPLLPEFLQRRRAKMTYQLRRIEELGLDRPTYFWVLNLSYRGEAGATTAEGDLESPYSTIRERWRPMAAAARGAGLVEEKDGRWHLTAKGRDLARRQHDAAREHYATLAPLPPHELTRLAGLLDRAFAATARAPEPSRRIHTPWALAYRDGEPAPGSFAQLDAAIFGLWQVRDDCHMSAWRATGIAGPDLEVLTRVWRGEAKDESGLFDKLPHQAPADFLASLERLRREGRVARDALRATADGTRFRQGIEDETDRLFFTPWPDDVGREGPWIREALGRVNGALT